METKLQKDIMESIKKNLPEQVAGQLKVVLDEYEELKKVREERDEMAKEMVKVTEDTRALTKYVKEYQEKEAKLVQREKAVQDRENKVEINELKILLKASDTVNEKVMGFVDALMRNTTYRKTAIPHSAVDGRTDSNGFYSSYTVPLGEDSETEAM